MAGGVYTFNSTLVVERTLFLNNFAKANGGGMFLKDFSNFTTINSCQFLNNTCDQAGALQVHNWDLPPDSVPEWQLKIHDSLFLGNFVSSTCPAGTKEAFRCSGPW